MSVVKHKNKKNKQVGAELSQAKPQLGLRYRQAKIAAVQT